MFSRLIVLGSAGLCLGCSAPASSSSAPQAEDILGDIGQALLGPDGSNGLRIAGDMESLDADRFRVTFRSSGEGPGVEVPEDLMVQFLDAEAFNRAGHKIGGVPPDARAFEIESLLDRSATVVMSGETAEHLPDAVPFQTSSGFLMGQYMFAARLISTDRQAALEVLESCEAGQGYRLHVGYGSHYDPHDDYAYSYETDIRMSIRACPQPGDSWAFLLQSIEIADADEDVEIIYPEWGP